MGCFNGIYYPQIFTIYTIKNRLWASCLIKDLSESFSGLKDLAELVSDFAGFPPESSIDWLCLDPKAFDQMLSERYNWDKKKSEQNEEENYADQLADMNKKMKDFVKTTNIPE